MEGYLDQGQSLHKQDLELQLELGPLAATCQILVGVLREGCLYHADDLSALELSVVVHQDYHLAEVYFALDLQGEKAVKHHKLYCYAWVQNHSAARCAQSLYWK